MTAVEQHWQWGGSGVRAVGARQKGGRWGNRPPWREDGGTKIVIESDDDEVTWCSRWHEDCDGERRL